MENNKPSLSTFATVQEYKDADAAFDAADRKRRAEDAERLPAEELVWESNYRNGPGNVPRLPDRVVDTLIDGAGVSRCAPGRGVTVIDQTAAVEALVHGVCEELLARLPDAHPAARAVDAEELGKLVALAEAATPGEWHWEIPDDMSSTMAVLLGANDARVCDFGSDEPYYPCEGTEPDAPDMAFMAAANPAAILRIAALVAQQAARIQELEARQRAATDEEVAAWAERYDISNRLGSEARSAFEDAASLHLTFKEGK